jgi:hypothetical protein
LPACQRLSVAMIAVRERTIEPAIARVADLLS